MHVIQRLAHDVRLAFRMLRKAPAFTATIVLTLAVGIGMTSAVFSVFSAVVLRPLSYPNPDRLMWVSSDDPQAPFRMETVLGPHFLGWRTQATSFEHMVAYDLSDEPMVMDGAATRERIAAVSDGFWELSGVRLAQGRFPAAGERDVLLASYELFETKLGSDPRNLGKTVVVDGRQAAIVGVLPRTFVLQLPWPAWPGFEPRNVTAYRTMHVAAPTGNQIQLLNVIAKLRAGVTIEQARAELETIRGRMAQANPRFPGNRLVLRITPLSEKLSAGARLPLSVLLSAVVFVLLIACANVASLLFGRGSARQKEIAIRAAVGAGRARLIQQLLIESLILAVAGGAVGLTLARAFLAVIVGLVPYAMPRLIESSIDVSVLSFTVAASIVTALVFGVAPALATGRVNLQHALMSSARASSSVSMTRRAGRVLVAVEMALAVVLLTGAGLLVKSFWRLNAQPEGFDPANVLTMKIGFNGQRYEEDSRRQAYIEEFLRRAASVGGVIAAGISTHGDTRGAVIVEGATPLPPDEVMQRSSIMLNVVSGGSAQALGMRVVRGRWFSDGEPTPSVAINESLARRDFPLQDPIGRRIRVEGPNSPLLTIVGVVADLRYATLDEIPEPEVYLPYSRNVPFGFTAAIRTSTRPADVTPAIVTLVSGIDRTLPVSDVQTLERAQADSIAPRRLNLFLLSVFAAAALALALTGIYSVVAYSVRQRTHEIGIRMALGAARRDVVGMIVRQGVGMAAIGIACGVALAAAVTRVMMHLLYEVQPTDLPTFAIAAAGLTFTAVAASLIPALRAARIDPAETFR